QRIFRTGRQPALQHSLQRRIGIVLLREGQVVDKDDELQRYGGNLVHQRREIHQRFLRDLDHAQSLRVEFVEHGLDRGRLARAAVPIQQAVVGRQALQKGQGVVDGQLALDLIALEVRKALLVRV